MEQENKNEATCHHGGEVLEGLEQPLIKENSRPSEERTNRASERQSMPNEKVCDGKTSDKLDSKINNEIKDNSVGVESKTSLTASSTSQEIKKAPCEKLEKFKFDKEIIRNVKESIYSEITNKSKNLNGGQACEEKLGNDTGVDEVRKCEKPRKVENVIKIKEEDSDKGKSSSCKEPSEKLEEKACNNHKSREEVKSNGNIVAECANQFDKIKVARDKEISEGSEKQDKMPDVSNSFNSTDKSKEHDHKMDCDDMSSDESDKQTDDYPVFDKRAANDPNFAVVFSFLTLFGGLLNITEFSLKELEEGLDNCTDFAVNAAQHGLLEKLHIKLLRRLSRSCKTQFSSLAQVSSDRLLKYLIRFSKTADLDLAWDLEKFGYHVLGSSERLLLLKALCEIHFDENPRFKAHFTDEYIKTDNIDALRLEPFGRDINGKMIWFQQDKLGGFRIYSVEDDDADGNTWKLIASTMEELDNLVVTLRKRAEVNPKDIAFAKRKERKAKAKETPKKNKAKGKAKSQQRKRKDMSDSESDEDDDNPCAFCFSNKRPDLVLLCDFCDAAYHTLCLRPPLMTIPGGDWHCPYCQQNDLLELLEEKGKELLRKIRAIEKASKRAIFDDIKLSNIVNKGNTADDEHSRRSGRQKKSIDYNFSDFDQIINDATQEGKRNLTDGSSVPVGSFYHSRRQRKSCGSNNLDERSSNSNGSDYDEKLSANENESQPKLMKIDDFLERGCRRSRRLRRRFKEEDDAESSESEEEHVRRSSRRRVSTQQKYMEYETDSEVEDVEGKKEKSGREEDEEYEVSELDDDYEEEIKLKRRLVVDDDEEPEDEEEETDEEFENEALKEDFKKTVVDDESEEDNFELSEDGLEDEQEDVGETDGDSEAKASQSDANSEDSEIYRMKKRKRSREVDEESDGETSAKKRGGGKDMKNIIKNLQEEEKMASKNSSLGSDLKNVTKSSSTNEISEKENGNNEVRESKIDQPTETSREQCVDESNELKINKELDKNQSIESHKDVPNTNTFNRTEEVETKDEPLAQEQSPTNEPLSPTDAPLSPKNQSLSPELGIVSLKRKDSLSSNRKETPSPLLGDFENAELEKLSEETLVAPVDALKQAQVSTHLQGDPLSFLKGTKGPGYAHDGRGNPLPRRPDLIPIPRPGHMPDLYRSRPEPGEFKQFDYFQSQQHMAPFSPMQNPYSMHSPPGFYGSRSEHYPAHMQSMVRGAPPVYQGHQSLPGSAIWRPQEAAGMGWGHSPHPGNFPTRTSKQTPSPYGYPYPTPDMNLSSPDYGLPVYGSAAAKPVKKPTASWPTGGRTASNRPSTSESYAAFQNMVIGQAGDSQRKKAKKNSNRA